MRLLNSVLVIAVMMTLAAGCRKDDLKTGVQPINVMVKVSYSSFLQQFTFPLEKIKVTLRNDISSDELSAQTDKNGIAVFNQVASARYNVTATLTLDKATYEAITGEAVTQEEVHLNATQGNLLLNPLTNNVLELELHKATVGDWVMKQIYYAGSHTQNGAVNRDQFIEIYNNSNVVLYADSLYFGQLMGNNTRFETVDMSKSYYVKESAEALYKQFNWGMSIGITPSDASAYKNYVYMKSLYRIPGTGKQYPVQPGESFIVATTAINHKAPFVDANGKSITVKDPSLTIDLSQANFEVYLGNVIPNPIATDIDNGLIPNVLVIEPGNRDLVLDPTGRDALVIFRTEKSLPLFGDAVTAKGFGYYPDPTVTTIDGNTSFYYQIPNDIIIDAVQIQNPSPTATQRVARKLGNSLDAGPTNVPDGQYTSQSLIRKTLKTVSGRKILMDTNNSASDFDFFTLAQPGGFKN
jgi:hypothetical protein